ncbi:MAG: site-2 protease family protein [Bryobacteraceae bacterium]
MPANGYPPPWVSHPEGFPPGAIPEDYFFDALAEEHPRPKHRYWLHILLLLLTLVSTSVVGAGMALSFAANKPVDFSSDLEGFLRILHEPSYMLSGLPFSLALLAILLTHEMGHYVAARYYRVDCTLPFFLPAPTLIGTMGAFIRIRSRIPSKRALFDIGIGGPLSGFVALLFPLAIGLSYSKVIPGIAEQGDLMFGTPLLIRLFEMIQFPGIPVSDIYLHPMARASWVGLLATALNLLPIGQLDGGHILYAFVGEKTRVLTRIFLGALLVLGSVQVVTSQFRNGYSWLFWATVLFFIARKHPVIYDPRPLSKTRQWLGFAALVVLILSFTPNPVRT